MGWPRQLSAARLTSFHRSFAASAVKTF